MKKIAITGGPSAGKTSVISKLKEVYSNNKSTYFAPEIASMLLGNDFPRPTEPKNIIFQQKAIFQTQLNLEELVNTEKKYSFVFYDRGLLDALIYVDAPLEVSPMESQILLNRYNMVLQLEVAPPFKYGNQNNKARTESYEEALKLEKKLSQLYSPHRNYHFIASEETFEEKFSKIQGLISKIMS